MKKQEVALITYHDNGQISEVKIRNQETNLIKKSSVYNRNGILTQQRPINFLFWNIFLFKIWIIFIIV